MNFTEKLKDRAREQLKKIILPEGMDERTLKATEIILEEGFAEIILIGDSDEIKSKAADLNLKNIEKATVINPLNNPKKEEYTNLLYELRKSKGMTIEDASKLVENPLYLSVLMIKNGDADGEVAGAANPTGDVLRPAFQIVKTLTGISVV